MTRARKPKGDQFDRTIAAMGKLYRTRSGRKFLTELGRDHGEAMVSLLARQVGKP